MVLLYVSIMVVISMAIIIPSRNIYEKNHNKIRDNVIDNVEIDGSEVVPDDHYEEVVYGKSMVVENTVLEPFDNYYDNKNLNIVTVQGLDSYRITISSSQYVLQEYVYHEVYVPTIKDNTHIIQELFDGVDEDGNSNIKYTISGTTEQGNVSSNWQIKVNDGTYGKSLDVIRGTNNFNEPTSTNLGNYELPKSISHSQNDIVGNSFSSSVGLKENIDWANVKYTKVVINDEEFFKLNVKILAGITTVGIGVGFQHIGNDILTNYVTKELVGTYTRYIPKQVDITFYGNTIGIDLVDKTVKIGSGNHPFSIGGSNELLQTSNYIDTVQCKAIDTDYNNTLTKYSNGKETATILCSISDYYDESKNKVIAIDNSDKMCFRMYDIVEPYVFGANGQDKPLSKNKDGSPKQFQVLGVKPIYDGAVWQELTLQEV